MTIEPICYEWIPCSDENYWTDQDGYITIIKYTEEYWHDVDDTITRKDYIFTQHDCPYGWNVLVESNAKLMNIKL